MASSSSSSSANPTFFPPPPPFTVSQDQFKIFHNVDRTLFTRLIYDLNRPPSESIKVMAFFLWLEHSGESRHLVSKILKWTDAQVVILYDEAVMCLTCIERDALSLLNSDNYFLRQHLPFIQIITKSMLSLMFFHENHNIVLRGVRKILDEICERAFEDIMMQYRSKFMNLGFNNYNRKYNREDIYGSSPSANQDLMWPVTDSGTSFFQDFDAYASKIGAGSKRNYEDEIGEKLRLMNVNGGGQQIEREVLPTDDRTIFLTFSKGYPISENEVRFFFTRKFGDCIEAIHMQEVASVYEQPLFARLVVHPPAVMDVILDRRSKAKFSINGKHVWARKYVRKNHGSPSKSPPQPSSPARRAAAESTA